MAHPEFGSPMGLEWCKILGISPENVRAITFRLAYNDLGMVEIERILLNTELKTMESVIERYEFKAVLKESS